MSPELERLINLQHLETQIAEAKAAIAAYPRRLAEADARLAVARQTLDAAKQHLTNNQDARRTLEKEAAAYQGRLSKFRDQQGAVKTNKEYQALGHEIETAQHDLGAVEEQMIERMVEADAIAAEVKQAEGVFAGQQKQVDGERRELAEDLAATEARLQQATTARAALVTDIDPRYLALFEQVARARKGVALSTATREGLCAACHVRLRPQVFQQVRANDQIIQCDSCQRILYYVPPPPPIEQARVHSGPAQDS
jgi:predicted  nucleic acid-binding Zn-ribbon protein